jgi:hypothetical protein
MPKGRFGSQSRFEFLWLTLIWDATASQDGALSPALEECAEGFEKCLIYGAFRFMSFWMVTSKQFIGQAEKAIRDILEEVYDENLWRKERDMNQIAVLLATVTPEMSYSDDTYHLLDELRRQFHRFRRATKIHQRRLILTKQGILGMSSESVQ